MDQLENVCLYPAISPKLENINIFDSLDERVAVEHFLGKTLEEAELLFRENSSYYMEDLVWMGAPAFWYYVQAAVRYIASDASAGDFDAISSFIIAVGSRLNENAEEVKPVAKLLAEACGIILSSWSKYGLEDYANSQASLERALDEFVKTMRA